LVISSKGHQLIDPADDIDLRGSLLIGKALMNPSAEFNATTGFRYIGIWSLMII
jgi:hypothetical protein